MAAALAYFPGVDRTVEGWEGLEAAQTCLPDDEKRDSFARSYSKVAQLWEAISPDPILKTHETDYRWLTAVYESMRPSDHTGRIVWHALGAKTLELINSNVTVDVPTDDLETIILDAEVIEELGTSDGTEKVVQEVEVKITARLAKHGDDPVFRALGERLVSLKERYAQGQQASIDFLRELLSIARDTVAAEKAAHGKPREDKGKSALTELFEAVRADGKDVLVERVVNEIDSVVRAVCFDGWQETRQGDRDVQKALREVLYVKFKLREQDVFERAYAYIREYY
jgi:type I restriction enzyme R subunit